ncbi:UV-stimulated scaffold protein A [Hydra vulgaris]|uniref:Uncharacterized protein KIAA1530 n=1 Tax=Hydra vulgaris TaxID=6087 RepID=T2MCK0_HYDVU|nr:UV-stimulated scaffold protein A [Hydra vulgaris]
MNEIDIKNDLFDAIEEITTSGKMHLDEASIKVIKFHCKLSSKNIKIVFKMLLKQLEKKHSQIRYSCVLIADELFSCSHLFRCLLLNNLRKFFVLTLETEPRMYPLPLPAGVAKELKLFTLNTFYGWYKRFSNEYRRLQLGFDYLKNVRCIDFSDISIRSLESKQKVTQEKEKEERIMKTKLDILDKQLSDSFENIMSTLKQLEECFTLLIPNNISSENIDVCDMDLSQTNFVDGNLRNETGLAVKSYAIDIKLNNVLIVKEDSSNKDIIKSMQDLYTESVKQTAQVKRWLNVLTKYDSSNHEKITKILKLKNLLSAAQDKYQELDIVEELDEENDFIDVPEKEFVIEVENTEKKPSAHCKQKRTCGFMLSNGKQCSRTDSIKCPFHGKIIERDLMGIPINEKDKIEELKKKQQYEAHQRKIIEKEIDAALGMNLSKQKKKKKLSDADKRKARYSRLIKIKTNLLKTKSKFCNK